MRAVVTSNVIAELIANATTDLTVATISDWMVGFITGRLGEKTSCEFKTLKWEIAR